METRRVMRGVLILFLATNVACAGRRLRQVEEQQKQILKELGEIKTTLTTVDKRLAIKQAMASGPEGDEESRGTPLAAILADPATYAVQTVRVRAVMATSVDKERGFFVVISKPKDTLNNAGVLYDADDISSKREVYLSDPGQWIVIEGQLVPDKEPNGFKPYSGYALKAKSVRRE